MPNHVHAIVRPTTPTDHPLEKIIQSWKRFATREINRLNNRSGSLWEEESFDRIIRDQEHLARCIRYIGKNPTKAGLSPCHYQLWLRPEWERLGWAFPAADT